MYQKAIVICFGVSHRGVFIELRLLQRRFRMEMEL